MRRLSGLVGAARNGEGRIADVSLVEASIAAAAWEAAEYLETGKVPQPLGNRHRLNAPYQLFETRDGRYLAIGTPNDALFGKLMAVLGLEAHAAIRAFPPIRAASSTRTRCCRWSSRPCARATAAELEQALLAAGVPCARVNNFKEVFDDPQIIARGVVREVEHPRLGRMRATRNPVLLDHDGPGHRAPFADAGRAFRGGAGGARLSAGRDPRAGRRRRDAHGRPFRRRERSAELGQLMPLARSYRHVPGNREKFHRDHAIWIADGRLHLRRGGSALRGWGELIAAMERALASFSAGRVLQPVRNMLTLEEGKRYLGIMPAVAEDAMGVKLVSFYPGNAGTSIPTHMAMILLFRPETGEPLAVMEGRLLTEMRTAAVSAAVTNRLASPDSRILALLGSGVQAEAHLEALRHVRQLDEVRVWSRTPEHAKRFAEAHGATVTDAKSAVRGADVIVTATNAREPILKGAWLKPRGTREFRWIAPAHLA